MSENNWDAVDTQKEDPRTKESELQVQRIINLQTAANNLPDSFTVSKSVTKSYIPTRNVPKRIEVPNKTIQLPCLKESERSTTNPLKRTRKQRDEPLDTVNETHCRAYSLGTHARKEEDGLLLEFPCNPTRTPTL
jgi:hypothetical protein